MIRSLFFLSILLASFAQAQLTIAVSVAPQAWLAKEIGGDLVNVIVIAPPDASAHTYEPKQSQLASLAKANIYLACGIEFERVWLDRFAAAAPKMKIYATDSGVTKSKIESKAGSADDSRIWLSVAAMRSQAQTTIRALSETDPANMGKYQINGMKLLQTIDRVKAQVASLLAPYREKAFLAYPPALGYVAKDYRLRQIAVDFRGEPKPADIAELKEIVKNEGIRILLVQNGASAKTAQQLAKELGVQIEPINVMEDNWEAMMHALAVHLINAFN
ncbi:MAG: zinc ABC transporter substrate-binding protein [Helicobacteraceae bacterium]|jgi:zinc transport system substrate-binding protein|nr:zinc ABC transporter substrate-binding protein [Helicobacteraceae bacterium]